MDEQWRIIDRIIAESPMPEEFRNWQVEILCADCHKTTTTLFHFEGLKCCECGSYNTTRCGKESPPVQPGGGGINEQPASRDDGGGTGAAAEGAGNDDNDWETEEEWEEQSAPNGIGDSRGNEGGTSASASGIGASEEGGEGRGQQVTSSPGTNGDIPRTESGNMDQDE